MQNGLSISKANSTQNGTSTNGSGSGADAAPANSSTPSKSKKGKTKSKMTYNPPRLELLQNSNDTLENLEILASEPDVMLQVHANPTLVPPATVVTQIHSFAVSRAKMSAQSGYFERYFATNFADGIEIEKIINAAPSGTTDEGRLRCLPRLKLVWQEDAAKTLRAVRLWLPLLHLEPISLNDQTASKSPINWNTPSAAEIQFAKLPTAILLSKTTLKTLICLTVLSDFFETLAILSYAIGAIIKVSTPSPIKRLFSQKTLVRGDIGRLDPGSPDADSNAETGENHFVRKVAWLSYVLDLQEPFRISTMTLILHERFDYTALHSLLSDVEVEEHSRDDALEAYLTSGLSPRAALPPWRTLPFEHELLFRQHAILTMLFSLPQFLMEQYLNGMQKGTICKRNYGNSRACDSFQLGHMARALYKARIFEPAVGVGGVSRACADISIAEVMAALKAIPDEQVDQQHVHCGLRSWMKPRLEAMEGMLSGVAIAIDLVEWKERKHRWVESEMEESWTWVSQTALIGMKPGKARKMCLAREWIWK